MFQFSGLASLSRCYAFSIAGCPIRKSTGQSLFAAHRSLSQLTTSFIASQSQGIHHVPLVALKNLKLYCYPTTNIRPTKNLVCLKIMWSIIDSRLTTIWLIPICQRAMSMCRFANMPMTEQILRLRTFRPFVNTLFERTVFVEDIGFEPMTPCVQGRCSSQLS